MNDENIKQENSDKKQTTTDTNEGQISCVVTHKMPEQTGMNNLSFFYWYSRQYQ